MASRKVLSGVFAALVALQIGAGLGSALASEGFFATTGTGLFPCRELQSAGNDDEALMLLGLLLVPSGIARLVRWRHRPSRIEAASYVGITAIVALIVVAGSDCGEPWATLADAREPFSVSFVLLGVLALAMMGVLSGPATMGNAEGMRAP